MNFRRVGAVAAVLFVVVVLGLIAFPIPTTFRCKALVDGMAEGKLVYPGAERVSYRSSEGRRDPLLMQLSNPTQPGFIAILDLGLTERDAAVRWYDERLRALGWEPLRKSTRQRRPDDPNPEYLDRIVFSTKRGDGEVISLSYLPAEPSLQYVYLIINSASVDGCN